jgi:uncharacterized protein
MVGLGLLVQNGTNTHLPLETPTTLNAWLHVSNACNLSCTYCYVSKSDEVMSAQVGYRAVDAVLAAAVRHDLPAVRLKFAGGEPTLNMPLVLKLKDYARRRAEELGLVLQTVLLSNGVGLGNQLLATLLARNIGLAVSLDGLDGSHDVQRPMSSGSGSARSVQRTVARAQALGLCPDVTITVTGRSVDSLPETVDWLLERGLPFALNFVRGHDHITPETGLEIDDDQLIAGVRRAFSAIEANLPSYRLIGSLLDRVQMGTPHHYPCAAAHSYLVIDHQGRVAQCQMALDNPVTNIWAADPLAEVRNAPSGIPGLSVDEKDTCSSCEWRYWCAGGCPLECYRAHGRFDAPSPFCDVYRALMPDLVRLEGLRLLRYAGRE